VSAVLDRLNSERIRREVLLTHALLHPEGYGILELVDSKVNPERIWALYPLDRALVVPQLTEGIALGSTGWELVEKMEAAMDGHLGSLQNVLTPLNYKRLHGGLATFEQDQAFEALCRVLNADAHVSKRRQRPKQAVQDSVVAVGDILWLAFNWESLPELKHYGPRMCQLLSDVQSVLPRAFNRLAEGDR
jgi:hypothetical protein